MESLGSGSVIESVGCSLNILSYYGFFDEAYMILSQLNKNTRNMLKSNIEMIRNYMENQRRLLKLNENERLLFNVCPMKFPLGLFDIEYYMSNSFDTQ